MTTTIIENELHIPKYDNLKKIGNKTKLLEFFKARKVEGYSSLVEWKIFKIERTYFVEVD